MIFYKPQNLKEFLGNKYAINKSKKWLKNWNKEKKKALLLVGHSGFGKSTFSKLLLKDFHIFNYWKLLESKKVNLNSFVKNIGFIKKNCLLIEDINTGVKAKNINDLIKNTKIPIVLTCTTKYEGSVKSISNYCECINIKKLEMENIRSIILNILKKENIKIKRSSLNNLILQCNYDIRSVINNIYFENNEKKKDLKILNVFDSVNFIFNKKNNLEDKERILYSNDFILSHFISDNFCHNNLELKDMLRCTDMFSDIDCLFNYQMKNQQYFFMPHQNYLKLKIAEISNNKRIKFPTNMSKMNQINNNMNFYNKLNNKSFNPLNFELIKHIINNKINEKDMDDLVSLFQKLYISKDDIKKRIFDDKTDKKIQRKILKKIKIM